MRSWSLEGSWTVLGLLVGSMLPWGTLSIAVAASWIAKPASQLSWRSWGGVHPSHTWLVGYIRWESSSVVSIGHHFSLVILLQSLFQFCPMFVVPFNSFFPNFPLLTISYSYFTFFPNLSSAHPFRALFTVETPLRYVFSKKCFSLWNTFCLQTLRFP